MKDKSSVSGSCNWMGGGCYSEIRDNKKFCSISLQNRIKIQCGYVKLGGDFDLSQWNISSWILKSGTEDKI